MENTTETTSTAAATSKAFHVWLWGVRLSAALVIATFLLLLCQHVLGVLSLGPCDRMPDDALLLALLFLATLLPNLLILRRVRDVSPTAVKEIKKGLALAVPWGAVSSIISLLLALPMNAREESDWGILALLALTQAVLVASAIGTYYSLGRKPKDWRILMGGFFKSFIYLFIFAYVVALFISPFDVHSRVHGNQSSAAGSVRIIYPAQITYSSTYNQGYAPKLEWLGPREERSVPTPERAGLIDSVLAAGEKAGYRFTLTPGLPDEEGKITSYTLSAQPITYKLTGCRSFFNDETGVIRATDEDRAATADDPPMEG